MVTLSSRLPARPVDVRASLSAVAVAFVVGLTATALAATPMSAMLGLGALLAVAALASVLVVAPHRLADILVLMAIGGMAIPVDAYLGYRDHVGGWGGFRVSASDLALIALLPVATAGVLVGRMGSVVPRSVLAVYGLLIAQYVVSFVNANDATLAGFELAAAVHALMTALLVGAAFRRQLLRPVIALIAIQVALHSMVAVAQTTTGRPIGAEWFTTATIVPETLETGAVRLRPVGLFDHPIVYANVLMLSLPVLTAGLFVRGGRRWRVGLVAAITVGLVGLTLSLSRGAWVSTGVAALCLVTMIWRFSLVTAPQMARLLVGTAVMAIVVGAPLAPRILERLTESSTGNLAVRFELNTVALSMIAAHPFAGIGLNNFVPGMSAYDPTNLEARFPAPAHNIYLLEAAEAGVPALILFVALFGTVMVTAYRRLEHSVDPPARWVGAAILAGLAGLLVSQVADFSHRLEPLRSIVWMHVGLLFALLPAREAVPQTAERGTVGEVACG